MELYFEQGALEYPFLEDVLMDACSRGRAIPVFMGAAKLDLGVEELMDAIIQYLPVPAGSDSAPLSGVV